MRAKNTLRLITVNTWKGDGRYGRRLGLLAKGLKRLEPDILCLQESLRTPDSKMDTAGYLGRTLGLSVTYAPGRFKKRKIEGEAHYSHSGLALLSKVEPLEYECIALPASAEDPDRSFLAALIHTKGHLISITNVHLTHLQAEDKLRKKQLLATIDGTLAFTETSIKNRAAESHSALQFICGDFNWQLETSELEGLEKESGLRLDDCYIEGGGELPGFTYGVDGDSPLRIDYIYSLVATDDPLCCKNSNLILTEKDQDGLRGSDHLGVMVDIEL